MRVEVPHGKLKYEISSWRLGMLNPHRLNVPAHSQVRTGFNRDISVTCPDQLRLISEIV